jgi:hypothetical protein
MVLIPLPIDSQDRATGLLVSRWTQMLQAMQERRTVPYTPARHLLKSPPLPFASSSRSVIPSRPSAAVLSLLHQNNKRISISITKGSCSTKCRCTYAPKSLLEFDCESSGMFGALSCCRFLRIYVSLARFAVICLRISHNSLVSRLISAGLKGGTASGIGGRIGTVAAWVASEERELPLEGCGEPESD